MHRPHCAIASRYSSLALLAALTLLAGCATRPAGEPPPISRWSQLDPGGGTSLRAIVAGEAGCPTALVDGASRLLLPRAPATPATPVASANPAFAAQFPVTSCELALPLSTRQVSIDGQPLPLASPDIRRIVVVGDTGCRIQVPASGASAPIQDCTANWPWPRVAMAAARTRPDLVIHLGDYHYREYCDNPALCSSLPDEQIGYGWPGWNADFFAPAAPLLAAAPWVVVRGNHENCDRAGEGWMRFLSPFPYQRCANQAYKTASHSVLENNLTANAYRIDLGGQLTLVVADNAGFEDYLPADKTPRDREIFSRTLTALRTAPTPVWLLIHKPVWYDMLPASAQPNALQDSLRQDLPANLQFVFAGHVHAFQTINFSSDPAAGRPAQVIVGASGTQLEAADPYSPFFEGKSGAGSRERASAGGQAYAGVAASSGIVLNRYSFLLLERDGEGWAATLIDPEGQAISHCRLHGERKEISCRFPGR